MSTVVANMSMSLDGFIADPQGGVEHLFGWYGNGPVETPTADPRWSFRTFVTEGVASAVAQARAVAGEKSVSVASADIAAQCIDAGLLDRVDVDLVPVLLGAGVPFFARLANCPVHFENPDVVQGDEVTHLSYRIRRTG